MKMCKQCQLGPKFCRKLVVKPYQHPTVYNPGQHLQAWLLYHVFSHLNSSLIHRRRIFIFIPSWRGFHSYNTCFFFAEAEPPYVFL